MDLSKLSDADLLALKSGDLSKVSTEGLMTLKGAPAPSAAPKQPSVLQMLSNVPGSALNFASGLANAVLHPINTAGSLMDMGVGAVGSLVPDALKTQLDKLNSPDQQANADRANATAGAVGQFYKNRYGGMDNLKQTVVEDPVGAIADLSSVLGVGGVLAPGKVGQALNVASKYTNPLSVVAPTVRAAGKAGKYVLGLTTGVGPENIATAFQSGKNVDSAFLKNLSGDASMTDVLTQAKDGLRNMRETRSGMYKDSIAATAADSTILKFQPIDTALSEVVDSLKQANHWTIGKDQLGKIKELQKVVQEWRMDPSAHTAIGLDALKRRLDALYPESPAHAQAQRAITTVRNAVKDTIVKQSPQYADTMSAYEQAISTEKEIERALSLGSKAAQDTALRKLQSLSRNNVNTNYGNRLDLAKTLESQGGVSLLPSIAGQAMNSWTARGLAGQAENIGTGLLAAAHNPAFAAALPFQSPKAVGASLYGLGRAAGVGGRAAGKMGLNADRARLAGLLGYQLGQDKTRDW